MTKRNDPIILDSSALVALSLTVDADHAKAVAISRTLEASTCPLLLPAEVFAETMHVIGKKLGHDQAVTIADEIIATGVIHVVESGDALRTALERFRTQPGTVSYTDCLVMAVADRFETKAIFGFDEVFRKNGYQLPRMQKGGQQAA